MTPTPIRGTPLRSRRPRRSGRGRVETERPKPPITEATLLLAKDRGAMPLWLGER
jgi:hypothetical protein